MEDRNYNQKGFLVPGSIKSMAAYHAKIKDDGVYVFRLHDCNGGVRLTGDLTEAGGPEEAVIKLRTLSKAAGDFADHIESAYPK